MQYEVVMGVRKNDSALKKELDRVIVEKKSEIDSILKNEGIPLLPISIKKSEEGCFRNIIVAAVF